MYVEQSAGGGPFPLSSSFISRYFISFPFCGMKWFREEPSGDGMQRLLVDGQIGGWVFGGSVQVTGFIVEQETIRSQVLESTIFPFLVELTLRGGLEQPLKKVRVRFATDDEATRDLWLDQFQLAIDTQSYLYSCSECGATPTQVNTFIFVLELFYNL